MARIESSDQSNRFVPSVHVQPFLTGVPGALAHVKKAFQFMKQLGIGTGDTCEMEAFRSRGTGRRET